MMCVSNMGSGAAAQAPVQALSPSRCLTWGRWLSLSFLLHKIGQWHLHQRVVVRLK